MNEFNNNEQNIEQNIDRSGEISTIPPEIKKFNWGAFVFGWIWGVGNKTYLALLGLLPIIPYVVWIFGISNGSFAPPSFLMIVGWIFGIVWMFVLGFKGNEWAWKAGEFKNPEEFLVIQRTWNRAGFVCFLVYLAVIIISIILLASCVGRLAELSTLSTLGNYY